MKKIFDWSKRFRVFGILVKEGMSIEQADKIAVNEMIKESRGEEE